MLLSQTIDTIDLEINQLYAQIEAKKQHQSLLIELDALTDGILKQLGDVVSKIKHHAPDATSSLREAVTSLLNDEDSGKEGGNQPTLTSPDTNPTPKTDDCATKENEPLNHQSSYQPADSYLELIQHPDNLALAYQHSLDGETICIYIGCNNQSRLKSWGEWIYRQGWGLTRQELNAIRPAVYLNFKYELKLPALPSWSKDILARHNYSKQPTMPPEKLPLIPKLESPFKLDSHIIRSSAPAEMFIVRPETIINDAFFPEAEKTGRQELVKVNDVVLSSDPDEAKVLCAMSSTKPPENGYKKAKELK